MIRRVLISTIVALSACQQPAKSCAANADCPAGSQCVESLCVQGSAGGSVGGGAAGGQVVAGGAAGSMGGGTAGGSVDSGIDAGADAGMDAGADAGTDAGPAPLCDGGCDVWAVCNGQFDGGVCERGSLTVLSPSEGAVYDAGQSVSVSAILSLPDGGPWPGLLSIPVNADWGQSSRFTNGTSMLIPGSLDAGVGRVTIGWPGGPIEARSVVFVSCLLTCDDYQQCVSDSRGGSCQALPLTVSVTIPANDMGYTRDAGLSVQVTVTSLDGGLPARVPVTVPGGSIVYANRVSPTSNNYAALVTLSGPDGVKTLTAGWDAGAGFSAQRSVTYDVTPPMVTVSVLPPTRQAHEQDPSGMNLWKKDESALVSVTVTDATSPVDPVTVAMVQGPGSASAMTATCSGCNAATGASLSGCNCFRVPLDRADISGGRGMVTITANGAADRAGNTGSGNGSTIVTRFKWSRVTGTASAGVPVRGVAVAATGLVLAPAIDGLSGRLTALNQNGAEVWSIDAGVVTTGAAVGSSVWVGTKNGASVAMSAFSLANGSLQQQRCQVSGNGFDGDFALTQATESATSYETPIGMRTGINFIYSCTPTSFPIGTSTPTGTPLVVARPGSGQNVEVFVNRGGNSTLEKFTFNNGWSSNAGITFSGFGSLVSLATGANFVGGSGGSVGPNNGLVMLAGNLVGVALAGAPSKEPSMEPTGDEPYGPISVGSGHFFAGTAGGNLRRFPYSGTMLGSTRDTVSNLGDLSKTTPVLGHGGLVYAVNAAGVVTAVDFGATVPGATWNANFFNLSPPDAVGQPALDVVRDGAGMAQCSRGLGVLYVPSVASGVATVTAVIVDSPGLDRSAPWPKYQRDNRNSGFADTSPVAACP